MIKHRFHLPASHKDANSGSFTMNYEETLTEIEDIGIIISLKFAFIAFAFTRNIAND